MKIDVRYTVFGLFILCVVLVFGMVVKDTIDAVAWSNVDKSIEISLRYDNDEDRVQKISYCMELFKANGFYARTVEIKLHAGKTYVVCKGKTMKQDNSKSSK